MQLVEHLQAYYRKWKKNVNEKKSLSQVLAKVRELEDRYCHATRSAAAPTVLEREGEVAGGLAGRLQPAPSQLIETQDQHELGPDDTTRPPSPPYHNFTRALCASDASPAD